MELLRTHPYGVQPVGNRAMFTTDEEVALCGERFPGLGKISVLDDSLLLTELCSFFDGPCLSFLSATSKFLYAFSHYEELWKKLVLEKQGDSFLFSNTWKETLTGVHHAPLNTKTRVFSDVLYQPFWCSALRIPVKWTEVETIKRESVQNLSVERFVEMYEKPNIPVILTGCDQHPGSAAAYKQWDREYLLSTASAATTFNAVGLQLSLSSYFKYSDEQKDDNPIYLFDKKFIHNTPQFGMDYEPLPYFSKDRDLFDLLDGTGYRPDHRWLIVGPERSGSRFHIDPNGTSAWNAVIRGKKKWIMFPPNSIPPGVHLSEDGGDVTSPVSLIEWFRGFYDIAREQMFTEKNGMVECVVHEGETVFVPSGWYHLVINLDFTIAVTQNYVSTSNLETVMQYLSTSPKLISGLPHDKRPKLRGMFESILTTERPEAKEILDQVEMKRKEKESRKRERVVTTATWSELILSTSGGSGGGSSEKDMEQPLKKKLKEKSKSKTTASEFSFGFSL
jgi:hypothetical protein